MKVFIFYFLLLIPIGQLAFSQNDISGTVTDSSGQPLPGATILVEKTNRGTTTDFDGGFTISASQGEILNISYVGFATAKITVGTAKTYNVQLQEDAAQLDEVVVVGYGSQKKVNLTGSVATVSFKEEVNQPVTNSGQLLYGRFSGVQLTQTSGNPGADGSSIVIRGIGTFGNSTPLVVIDNIQYDDLAAFNSLAPSDIESVTVLKDASASAIYGARGANGVILVTTRKGTEDKFEISFNTYYGVQDATVKPGFLGSYDYATLMNEKFRNEDGPGFLPRYTPDQIDAIRTGSLPDQFANTSWADEVLRMASIQNHNFSFSGGNSKTTYRLSLGYLGQDAIVRSKFKSERYNLSFNINSKLKDWFTLSSVSNAFWKRNEGPTGGQGAFDGDNGIIYMLQRTAPTIPAYYSNGEYGIVDGAYENSNYSFGTANPLRRGYLGNYNQDIINISQRIGLTFKLSDSFSFETSGSANIIYNNASDFSPTATIRDWAGNIVGQDQLNTLKNSTNLEYRLLNENILRYNKTFNKVHDLGILVGHSISYLRNDGFNGQLSGFPTDNLEEFNAGGLTNPAVNGGAYEEVTQSFFGRINYNYAGKYLAEFNLRRDGSSKFGPRYLYGNFPSASVGWNISKEKFLENADYITNLKIRASWGISGNDRIGNYIPYQGYNADQDYVLGNDTDVVGVAVTSLANPFIRWEQTEQYDLGLDLSLFKNKVELVADYFNRNSTDILYTNFPIPNTLGVTNLAAQNAASMINRGLELGLNYRGNLGNAKFSLGANLTKMIKNEVTGLGDGGEETISNIDIIRIGAPFKSYYGLKAIGIFQNLEEIANAPTQFGNANTAPGDIRYADISGPDGVPDGVVNDDDRTIIGNPNPKLLVNFNGSIEYKGFDLNFMFQGVSGVDRLLMGNGNLPMADDRSNVLSYWINRWTPDNPSAHLPRVGGQNNTRVSSFYVQDASYLRLKSLELGYSLPNDVLKKINISKLRVFVGAQNLFTFTGLEYFDPEGGSGSQSNRNAPLYKTITLGLNLKI
ncbi:SusC/RagA family TonB-linked outer membrane protein [Yeosuana aromativorans]|uniref:SusC/RagA family TonB-linked outer membrane protein n=1 Tax=Yeosuana aromativorans TaxID=288019 RepID=A0A8J3FFA8_9FLAO|nr:TonB-dependent receptor [Yeosuana aromativorans]GGK12153.1 SusC/RagA family TonB-linked outer membrane protein [Yeosuana aromativorans]